VRLASEVIRKSATLHMQHKSVLQERSSLARQSVQKIEEAAAAKLKAEEDAAKEKLDCHICCEWVWVQPL
jgi:hypothetical protein